MPNTQAVCLILVCLNENNLSSFVLPTTLITTTKRSKRLEYEIETTKVSI